jgi:HAD superfamily hydrolase (TIGR01509 family)
LSERRASLAPSVAAVLFDLDGVITDTAATHARAWKRVFDGYLAERSERTGERLEPFEIATDYHRYVDGKPRVDGVASFLAARGIDLPPGRPGDPPESETWHGIGSRKDAEFLGSIAKDGVETYPSSVDLVRRLRERGSRVAIFSASRNCRQVLEAAGAADLFDARVDGIDAERLGLPGKPDPATLLEAARRLGVEAPAAAVVGDALAGVEAGRRGGFGQVIGVDRGSGEKALLAAGADLVVPDLAELELPEARAGSQRSGTGR